MARINDQGDTGPLPPSHVLHSVRLPLCALSAWTEFHWAMVGNQLQAGMQIKPRHSLVICGLCTFWLQVHSLRTVVPRSLV